MANDERKEHFQGFARLLWQELLIHSTFEHKVGRSAEYGREMQDIIAQRAYDLVYHTLYYEGDPDPVTDWSLENILKRIPDLTKWPTTVPPPGSPTHSPPAQSDAPASPPASDSPSPS